MGNRHDRTPVAIPERGWLEAAELRPGISTNVSRKEISPKAGWGDVVCQHYISAYATRGSSQRLGVHERNERANARLPCSPWLTNLALGARLIVGKLNNPEITVDAISGDTFLSPGEAMNQPDRFQFYIEFLVPSGQASWFDHERDELSTELRYSPARSPFLTPTRRPKRQGLAIPSR